MIQVQKTQKGNLVVSARDLHLWLEIKSDFTDWCKRMFQYGHQEGKDYALVKTGSGHAHNKVDYALTLATAKDIALIQRNEKGAKMRQYLIEFEQSHRGLEIIPDFTNPGDAAIAWGMQYKARLEAEQKALEAQSKAVAYDVLVNSTGTYKTTELAKELGFRSANALYRDLHSKGIAFKQGKDWCLTANYSQSGYTKLKPFSYPSASQEGVTHSSHIMVWTEKGREFLMTLYGKVPGNCIASSTAVGRI